MAAHADAWKHQDGQIISRLHRNGPSHAQQRWNERIATQAGRPDLVDHPVRAAWREAEPVAAGFGWAKRAHPTGMVLVSEWACLTTCYFDETYRDSTIRYSNMEFTSQ